jgi:uncharacterized protein YjbI with pentapeptide repeats
MDGAKLNKAYLFGSRLNSIQARQADFTDAFMKDLNIANSDLSGSIFKRGNMFRAVMIGSNLSGADLQNADLTGSALEKANFTRANLKGASLKGVTLDETIFSGANLDQADFSDAVIENMDGSRFERAINLPEHLQQMLNP